MLVYRGTYTFADIKRDTKLLIYRETNIIAAIQEDTHTFVDVKKYTKLLLQRESRRFA